MFFTAPLVGNMVGQGVELSAVILSRWREPPQRHLPRLAARPHDDGEFPLARITMQGMSLTRSNTT